MTLTETLQLKERYLQIEDLRALDYCERRWKEQGCPTERWPLINFLERMLQELKNNGIGYPKVLLLRKKEIQRRTFRPEPREERIGPREPQCPNGEACKECKGQGFHMLPGGSGTLCMACLGTRRKIGVSPALSEGS